MQYLQMAQKVRQLVGLQGTGPSSVDATGSEGLFLSNVQNAWEDLQNYRADWKWMRENKTFNMVAGTTTYTPATIFGPVNRFKSWYKDSFFILVDGKKAPINHYNYDYFRYRHINDVDQTTPSGFTIRPKDYALQFSIPDSNYQIDCDYKKSNQTLSAATDIPELPTDYHMLIVYEAASRYALTIALGHVYDQYSQKALEMLGNLLREQNPQKVFKVRGIA